MNAYKEIVNMLEEGEKVEGIVFGHWGVGTPIENGKPIGYGFCEPGEETGEKPPVPFHSRGKVLTLEQAKPYMQNWSFSGKGYFNDTYSVYIHTNKRVFFVVRRDDTTALCSVPRNPENTTPEMFGG